MITPVKKPAGHELYDSEKEFNKKINTIRYLIERSIAQLKTWRWSAMGFVDTTEKWDF